MSKTVAYLIGPQSDQESQLTEIRAAGFKLDDAFANSPSEIRYAPEKRHTFQQVLNWLQPYDTLIVTRLNRLGRTAVEMLKTVKLLGWNRVKVFCLEAGDHRAELTLSDRGQLIMHTIAATDKLEREERDRRRNARTKTKRQGRPAAPSPNKRREALDRLATPDVTVTRVAEVMGAGRATIYRALKLAAVDPPPHARV